MSMYLCASIQRREPRCRTWRGCRKNLAEFSVAEPTWSSAAPSNRAGITFVEKQFLNQPSASMRRDDACLLDMLLAARDAVAFAGELTLWKFRQSRLHQNAILKSIDIVGEAAARVGIWPASRLTRVHMPLAYCSPASIATGRRFRRVGNGQVAKSVKAQGGFWALLKSTIVIPSGPGAYAYRYRPAG